MFPGPKVIDTIAAAPGNALNTQLLTDTDDGRVCGVRTKRAQFEKIESTTAFESAKYCSDKLGVQLN
jgi:hypothetical protein